MVWHEANRRNFYGLTVLGAPHQINKGVKLPRLGEYCGAIVAAIQYVIVNTTDDGA
jgi:hypothetical protein